MRLHHQPRSRSTRVLWLLEELGVVVGSVLGYARTAEVTEFPTGVVPYVDRLEARPARQRAVDVTVPA
jgi:hypothetical protein